MMGIKARIFRPIEALTLDDLVPADHFYRHLDRTLDLSFVRDLVVARYAAGGRPSIDPVVFFKLQLIMFFEGIRSERQLMTVAADRLSLRWYLGYDLHEVLPDHSSLTRIRDRYGLEIFRRFFDEIVERCIAAGLVWGQELYLDATKIDANAALSSLQPRFAVEAHLDKLFMTRELAQPEVASDPMPVLLPIVVPDSDLEQPSPSQRNCHDWIASAGQQRRDVTGRSYQRVADFQASMTDPDAAVMPIGRGLHLGYLTHYVVDGGKARIILQTLVTPAEVMENQPMLDLLWRTRFRWKLWPRQVTGDTTYGTIENIVAIEDQHIRAYVPLPDFDRRTPYFGKGTFTYDPTLDSYRCPAGETLRRRGRIYTERIIRYRAEAATCNACALKPKCTASATGRQVNRSFDEAYLERVRGYHETEPYQKAMRKRQVWVEPLFGEGKQWHAMGRFRLRRLARVNVEALLVATGQNLKRLLTQRGWGRRPFPGGAAGLALPYSVAPLAAL